ncbi:UNVERIFIED_CONTAM: Transposon Ty3-G Gag-Pol polyprotein [Sesamum calycinum]|uniref:Transposon Ty3-G Gag-Pol polyprotein n=1 Tax=Sesamum calycinum TaxID=2727403 RepID=A0AAW2P9Z1_9LAMI
MTSRVFSAAFSALTDGESLTFTGVMMVSRLRPGVFWRRLWLILGIMSTTRGDDVSIEQGEQPTEEEGNESDVTVSLYAMKGSINNKTLKISSLVGDKEILILIDCESTHCFIDEKVAIALGCKLEGAKMLSALSMAKLMRRRSIVTERELFLSHKTLNNVEENNKILELLLQFEDVYKEPNSLPPERNIEHCIGLLPATIPKKQHPYRYAYGQKTKIERIVKEMLNSGIIRPNHSSFASLVLLVKKKDGGWRFCVDYRKFALVFFDDILIYSTDCPLHLKIVEPALCKEEQVYLYTDEGRVPRAYHILGGVATDPLECMLKWPTPTTVKALREFFGLTGYYRKFIKGYGVISKPLTLLLKKNACEWNHEAEEAFNQLKEVMTTAPVLAMPDFSKPFIVETDASGKGIGVVLMQEDRPITYQNKALAAKNLGLSTYEKEFLALLLAVTKWRYYLQRNHFIIRTNQKSLKHILDQRIDSVLLQKWVAKLLGLSYEVQYQKGSENRAADALSRVGHEQEESQSNAITTQGYSKDGAKFVWAAMEGLERRSSNLSMILPEENWVKKCEVCQRSKHENNLYPGLPQPLPIPEQAWSCISMDFIEGLPSSEGKDSILVGVDRITKYSHFIALKHPYTATSIAKLFFDNIYKLHGLPMSIVTDKDKIFTSKSWKELFSLSGVSLDMSSAYHPQSDGQTERVNQCLENYLRCMCHQKPKWAQWLTLAEFWFNTNFHTGLAATPFQAVYAYPPHQLSIGPYLQNHHTEVEELMQERVEVL